MSREGVFPVKYAQVCACNDMSMGGATRRAERRHRAARKHAEAQLTSRLIQPPVPLGLAAPVFFCLCTTWLSPKSASFAASPSVVRRMFALLRSMWISCMACAVTGQQKLHVSSNKAETRVWPCRCCTCFEFTRLVRQTCCLDAGCQMIDCKIR